ncbi:signal transducing adaptor molecule [Cochliomyia hominivorax]
MGIFSQSTSFDSDVEKATSETNTNENWTLILEVCDKVSLKPSNAKECLKAIMKRMAHNDPHVVMQAITLLDACASNCGKIFHLEIASREFQTEFKRLLSKAQPKLKAKMFQVLKSWAEGDFKNDSELNLIPSLYAELRDSNEFSSLCDKPMKSASKLAVSKDPNVVTSQQEEEDLAKAIELSLKEVKNSPKQGSSSVAGGGSNSYPSLYPSMSSSSAAPSAAVEPRKVRALYDFEAAEENELTFVAGEIIHVTDDSDPNWWKGYNQRSEGLFPSNFVTADLSIDPERLEINQQHKMKKSTQFEEDSKELQQKTEAAAAAAATQRIDIDEQKVDRLLHLLNEANPEDPSQDTEEMLRLEQEVHQMGPLIDAELERVDRKHAQLSQLSSDLVDAINLYHSLMRDDRNALGSPYNMPGAMPGMPLPGTVYGNHPNMMYSTNPAFAGGFGPHSMSAGMNSLPYSPPAGNYPGQRQMSNIPMQYQNGHVGSQPTSQQPHSLQGLPHHMSHQMMPPQQQQIQNHSPQQQGLYGPQQSLTTNNLNAAAESQQLQQQHIPNQQQQHVYNHMLPSQQQQQHYMPQQAPTVTTTAATPIASNHLATPTQHSHIPQPQQQQPTPNQFISPQHQHVQQPPYMNSPSNQPSTNPHLYNQSVGDQQQQQIQQPTPSYMNAPQNVANNMPPTSGPLDQFGQLQQQMSNMSMSGPQPYQTNLQQNIPIYQQQR